VVAPAGLLMNVGGTEEGRTNIGFGITSDSNGRGWIRTVSASGQSWGDLLINDQGGRVGIGTPRESDVTHSLTVQSPDGNNIRVIGPGAPWGQNGRINFGDIRTPEGNTYVTLNEDVDDSLRIEASTEGGGGRQGRIALNAGSQAGNVGIGTLNPQVKLDVNGVIRSLGPKQFSIDHPLDPENKMLNHACVESDQAVNIYRGNVVTDIEGRAIITLPEWFEALNTDFSYHLTAVGAPAPLLHVEAEIAGNSFIIAGGAPQLKVSWVVTAVRNDPYVRENPMIVEELKPHWAKGTYIYPRGYGKPDSLSPHRIELPVDPSSKNKEPLQ
jgi:hypothetical protein